MGVLKNNREKKRFGGDGHRARHVLVGQASCLSHLIDGLEAGPTTLHQAPILIGYGHKTFENYFNSADIGERINPSRKSIAVHTGVPSRPHRLNQTAR
jgi:hypothetical protein